MTELFQKHFNFKNGIWHSQEPKNISYDSEGTANCFQIEDTSYWFKHRQNCVDVLIEKYCNQNESFADVGGGIPLDIGVVHPVILEVGRVGQDGQVAPLHLVPQIDLAGHAVQNFHQRLVPHIHGDGASDSGVDVHIELGITRQGKQQEGEGQGAC